jgi:poly-gamma-glutamate synthesis protein (capsule biosynthesis protein)
MTANSLTLFAVGDLVLGDNAEKYFKFVEPVLKTGDVVLGQLEHPYTARHPEAVNTEHDPENLKALISAGFNVVTLAGNHLADFGIFGIEDTIEWLKKNNISYVGAGMNISEARQPVVIEREGTRFGFLDYNCVGPKETWATKEKAGCAYINVITHYELDYASPGGPPNIYTWAEPDTLGKMVDDIQKLRPLCDILVVSLHKGLVHIPVKIAAYEQQVSHAAIDAGADLTVGHHAHILKGIEIYKGKVIFHGLCNLVNYRPGLAPKENEDPQSWVKRRREIFGFEPDPEYPTYPFHPEAKYTIIAKCTITNKNITQVSYIPCLINKEGQPEVVKRNERGEEVFDYVAKITNEVGLNAKYDWEEDNEVLIYADSDE